MAITDNIRALEAARMKRQGASLVEIAKFWNVENPVSRQRVQQIVKKGERLLNLRDNPMKLENINIDQILTKEIAYELGLSGRLSTTLGKLGYSINRLDYFLTNNPGNLIAHRGLGIDGYNELAKLFGRPLWKNKYFGKQKYMGKNNAVDTTIV